MAVSLKSSIAAVAAFFRQIGTTSVPGAGEAILSTHLEDLNGNPLAVLDGAQALPSQYGLPQMIQNDENMLVLRGDRSGGLAIATIQPLISWMVDGAVLNARVFTPIAVTMAAVQTVQGLTLNSGNITTLSTSYQLNTQKQLPMHMKAPILMRLRAKFTQHGVANANAEYGLATVNTTLGLTPNLNGFYWRIDSNGVMPVLAINGVVAVLGTDIRGLLSPANIYHWGILKDDEAITFTVQDPSTGVVLSRQVLRIPNGQTKAFIASHAQPYVRVWHNAVAPVGGMQCVMSEWTAGMLDCNFNMTAPQLATALGLGSETIPTTGATTSNLLNAAVAPTTVPTNTTATATTLDGAIRMAAPAGSVTDLALFTYLVPLPYQYRTKRVRIGVKNLGAAVATTATQIDFYLCVNSPGVTLVGSLVRKYIGTQTFAVGAAIGSTPIEGPLEADFTEGDLLTEAGKYVILVARISTGTATVSQVLEINYANIGHFE